jgi:hypothetical protein
VYGFSGLAVMLHNTGSRKGRTLDEYLAAVLQSIVLATTL